MAYSTAAHCFRLVKLAKISHVIRVKFGLGIGF